MITTIVIKAIRACNLRCSYCYYINDDTARYGLLISQGCVEALYSKYSEYCLRKGPVDFIWHGGEPLMLGKARMRRYLELQRNFFDSGGVRNSIQTNATLIDDEWIDLFQAYNVSVGVSLDGPPRIHNRNRPTTATRGSYDEVLRGIERLKARNLPIHVLLSISPGLDGAEAVAFLENLEVDGCDFLLPMSNNTLRRARVPAGSSDAETHVRSFLVSAFNEWTKKERSLNVRLFEDLIRCAFGIGGGVPYAGPSTEVLSDFVLLETDGELCMDVEFGEIDRHKQGAEYQIGHNILDSSCTFASVENALRERIRVKGLTRLPDECQRCQVRSICRASHPGSRYDETDQSFNHKSAHCDAMYSLSSEIIDYISDNGLSPFLTDRILRESTLLQ